MQEYKKTWDQKAYRRRQREKIIDNLGGICECCGEDKFEFLQIDHIHGGGYRHYKEEGTYVVRKDARLHPEKYRVLCANCNISRGFWGYCPHEKEEENDTTD